MTTENPINFDEENGTLTIKNTVAEPVKKKLRGFIVYALNKPEEIEAFKKGDASVALNHLVMPYFAKTEEAVKKELTEKGYYIINIHKYEMILAELELLQEISKLNNIELILEDKISFLNN